VAPAQSPGSEERNLWRAVAGQGEVMLEHPKRPGIPDPVNTGDPVPQAASGSVRHTAWHLIPTSPAPGAPRAPEETNLKVLPSAGRDQVDSTITSSTKWHGRYVKPASDGQRPWKR
jgi:hypothetical protein